MVTLQLWDQKEYHGDGHKGDCVRIGNEVG